MIQTTFCKLSSVSCHTRDIPTGTQAFWFACGWVLRFFCSLFYSGLLTVGSSSVSLRVSFTLVWGRERGTGFGFG